ncbi:hypothetical protein [Cryobacterium sp. TMT1-66-1]|uniref:hypothetical protein n=1 Tax=Cryobacterium sp. TMT1-66-1 TaxID=1259242 RepID=UPI001068DEB8|nr:hypothetical protein [Cryobacterium sp. TMT1-66-1]TFD05529.1 hypothetical protein E3T29_12760 [Cryobacterium sp. TMT1-66-1]
MELQMNLDWGDFPTWLGSSGALVAACLAGIISLQLRSRERKQAISSIHIDLTTGETAQARNVIGTVLYATDGLDLVGQREAISALFKLYWAVQRAQNTYRVYRLDAAAPGKMQGQEEFFLSWNFRELVENIVTFHRDYGERLHIKDEDAWNSFEERLRAGYPDLFNEFLASSAEG